MSPVRAGGEAQDLIKSMRTGYVYMMSNRKRGVIYIGFTVDMVKRGWEHRNKLIEGFTKQYNLIRLVWFERHDSIEKASAMEKKLKNLHRKKKIEIIERENPEWRDLYPEIIPYDPALALPRAAGL